MISPVIRQLQPALSEQQQAVVGHTQGPLLVIAGPGSGKTRCIVWRAVNLLLLGRGLPRPSWCSAPSPVGPPTNCGGGLTPPPGRRASPQTLAAVRITTVHSLCHAVLSRHGCSGRPSPQPHPAGSVGSSWTC